MPRCAQPVLGRRHDRAAKALAAVIGIDGDVIDPAAMAVMADHGGGDDRAAVAADQHRRIVRPAAPARCRLAGSFHGRVRPQRCHSAMTSATSASAIAVMRRHCAGSGIHSTLPGIHDAVRIEHRLDAAHQLDRDLVLDVGQLVALEHADAVLGRDRAAHPQHDREHDRVDLVPARQEVRGVAADRLADIVMDIAVAEMAERHRPRARDQLHHRGIGLRDEGGHGGDRHRDVVLDRAAFRLLRRRHLVAQLPERLRAG